MTSTLLNEFRVGFNKFASSRYPPAGVPSMQDLGVRLPIYPTDPVDLADRGNRVLRHRRQPLRDIPTTRRRDQRPRQLGEGTSSDSVRRRNGLPGREDPQRVPAGRTLTRSRAARTAGTGHALADFVLGQHQYLRPGHRRIQGLQGVLRVVVPPGRHEGVGTADAEHGRPVRALSAMARGRRAHHALERRGLQRQRAIHGVPGSAARRDVSAATRVSSAKRVSRRRPTPPAPASALRGTSPATAKRAFAAAAARSTINAVTANRATARSTRHRSACVWPSHAGARARWTILGSLSRPQRLQSHHRRGRRHGTGAVPDAGADLDIRRRVQGTADLQLQPHVRARGVQRA